MNNGFILFTGEAFFNFYIMMPGSKGQKAVHACRIRLLNLGPAKHEEGAIYLVNLRIPNVCRIEGIAFAMEQSVASCYFIEETNNEEIKNGHSYLIKPLI